MDDVNQIIKDNQALVVKIANKFNPRDSADFEDYKQAGNLGLWKAAQKFKESMGVKFSTFAWKCITNEIIRYIQKQKRSTRAYGGENQQMLEDAHGYSDENFEDILPSCLTEREKEVVQFRRKGYSFKEIAKMTGGVCKGTAGNILRKAIKKIRKANE